MASDLQLEKGSPSADGVLTMCQKPLVRGSTLVTRLNRQVNDPFFSYQQSDHRTRTSFFIDKDRLAQESKPSATIG